MQFKTRPNTKSCVSPVDDACPYLWHILTLWWVWVPRWAVEPVSWQQNICQQFLCCCHAYLAWAVLIFIEPTWDGLKYNSAAVRKHLQPMTLSTFPEVTSMGIQASYWASQRAANHLHNKHFCAPRLLPQTKTEQCRDLLTHDYYITLNVFWLLCTQIFMAKHGRMFSASWYNVGLHVKIDILGS